MAYVPPQSLKSKSALQRLLHHGSINCPAMSACRIQSGNRAPRSKIQSAAKQDKFIVLIDETYLRGLEPEQRERIPRAKFFSFIFLADPKFTPIFPSIGREVSVPGEINSPLLPTCPIDIGNGPCDQQRHMRAPTCECSLYCSSSRLLIYLES